MAIINQDNLKRITEAMNRFPDLDYSEVAMMMIANKLVEKIEGTSDDQWDGMKIEDAVNSSLSLARVKTYKRRTDSLVKTKQENGMQGALDNLFELLGKEHPELYNKVYDIAAKQLGSAAEFDKSISNGDAE